MYKNSQIPKPVYSRRILHCSHQPDCFVHHRGVGTGGQGGRPPPQKNWDGGGAPLPKRKNTERRRKMTKVHCAPKKSYGPFSAITHLRGNTNFFEISRKRVKTDFISLRCETRHDNYFLPFSSLVDTLFI